MLTDIKLIDVNGEPRVRKDLPGPLRIGDPIKLRFRICREQAGRREILEVEDRVFRVTTWACDDSSAVTRQIISVETAQGKPPVWRSVKRTDAEPRSLPPAVFPRTPI